ncbi:MAG TPA: ABC transporter ATP-binding protein [Acidimicrobiales bacterium]
MTTHHTGALLELDDLVVELPTDRGLVRVLDGVSFTVDAGELVGLAGESGSGKTMTALAIMRLLPGRHPVVRGQIRFDGRDLLSLPPGAMRSVRGKDIAMVFQEPMTSLHPAWTVGEQIAEGIRAHAPVSRSEARRRAIEMLERVGIPEPEQRARQYAFQFSGGMQQRVMIAIALACRPRLLIADEPTTALDVTIQAQITELITELQRELGMAVMFVTHDLGLLAGLTERLVVMYGGQIVEDGPTEDVFLHPKHPYTEALLLAAPHPELKGARLPTIPGAPPQPASMPTGCRFHPRCRFAEARCGDGEPPPLTRVGPDRRARCLRVNELDLRADVEEVLS